MLESSKKILADSDNSVLSNMGGTKNRSPDYSRGIPVAKTLRDRYVYVNVQPTTKIGLFGPSGSGKTIAGKGIAARLNDKGRIIYNGGDVKNDFKSLDNKSGCSDKLIEKMGLAPNEEPHPIDKALFVPKFLVNDYERVPDYVEPFSFGFQDVSETDFQFLLGGGDLSGSQQATINNIMNQVDINDTDFDELLETIDSLEDANSQTRKSIKSRVKSLKSEQIISNRYRKNPVDDIEAGKAVSLGLKGWRNYQHGDLYKLEFYSALLLRNLKERATGLSSFDQNLVAMWAEIHKLASAGSDSLLKREIQDYIDMAGRQMNMPLIMDSQAPSQIPNSQSSGAYDFLGRLSHIFLGCDQNGRALGENEWKKVLKSANLLTRSNKKKWRKRIAKLDRYQFLYVNPGKHENPRDCPIVEFLAPIVAHPG